MNLISTSIALIFLFILSIPSYVLASHFDIRVTDTREFGLVSFFDLRDRESFIQITNTNDVNETGDDDDDDDDDFQPGNDVVVHVQIFNVDDNCNENNFYDTYTPNDTHTYNMRDIQDKNGYVHFQINMRPCGFIKN